MSGAVSRTALPELNFPPGRPFDLRGEGATLQILDRVRRRFVRLTPEEWVRQHLLRTLLDELGYPPGLLALEPTLATAAGPRRPDVVVMSRAGEPVLIAECKAPSVRLRQEVFAQVSRYNVAARAPVLLVTNGADHFCWRVDRETGRYEWLDQIPPFYPPESD